MPPADPRDWVPAEHLVWFVSDLVDMLDLTPMPRGVRASRKIAGRLDEDVAFRALAAANRPDFRTISEFRKIHLGALEGLFEQVFGQIKQARGIRQFLMRGLEQARGQWAPICTTHNISKLHRPVTV